MSRVLLVDDEKNVLTTLTIGLRRYQYDVLNAESGSEALGILEDSSCDIVVSDIRMSPMDGYTLAAEIKEKHPKVNVILMSAYEFEHGDPNYHKVADYSRLIKPFSIRELVETIMREENKNERGEVLFIGDAESADKCNDLLQELGCFVHRLETNTYQQEESKHKNYDYYIIDGDFINEERIAVLNWVDRVACDRPVLLLVRNSEKREQRSLPGISATVFDRERFFSDRYKMLEIINKCKNDYRKGLEQNN